jgi:3-isopropylmalate/(R)-2-methylmalate dehydratase small subunit
MPRVWRFGDHVSTDVITPGRMNVTTDAGALGRACFAEVRPELRDEARPGDVVVAGVNFGCGSSRESAPRAIQALGLTVVAASYGSIFYRNAVNVGLPVFIAPDARARLEDGDAVEIGQGVLRGPQGEVPLQGATGLLAEVVAAGGIVPYVRARGGRL